MWLEDLYLIQQEVNFLERLVSKIITGSVLNFGKSNLVALCRGWRQERIMSSGLTLFKLCSVLTPANHSLLLETSLCFCRIAPPPNLAPKLILFPFPSSLRSSASPVTRGRCPLNLSLPRSLSFPADMHLTWYPAGDLNSTVWNRTCHHLPPSPFPSC